MTTTAIVDEHRYLLALLGPDDYDALFPVTDETRRQMANLADRLAGMSDDEIRAWCHISDTPEGDHLLGLLRGLQGECGKANR